MPHDSAGRRRSANYQSLGDRSGAGLQREGVVNNSIVKSKSPGQKPGLLETSRSKNISTWRRPGRRNGSSHQHERYGSGTGYFARQRTPETYRAEKTV